MVMEGMWLDAVGESEEQATGYQERVPVLTNGSG